MRKHAVRHIAIGNGTASRETEAMTVDLLRSFPEASYMIVNEAGASVYSASPLAAEEFPEYDVNLRSAVSIPLLFFLHQLVQQLQFFDLLLLYN